MGFPIYYNGKILFRNGKPAFSTRCCCGPSPCVEDCGIFIGGNHLDVRTTSLAIFSWFYNTPGLQITGDAVDPSGAVEYLGDCQFRMLVSFVSSVDGIPYQDWMYGSVRNNIWQFDSGIFTFTGSLEDYPPNANYYIVTNGVITTRFSPTMNPCDF
jgi:hypothetical protein